MVREAAAPQATSINPRVDTGFTFRVARMKSKSILVFLVVMMVLSIILVGCDPFPDKDEKEIKIDTPGPGEPPDDPPPDPPPPPSQTGRCLAASTVSLESIATGVLRGEYGTELQYLLAKEISVCLNMMAEKKTLSIFVDSDVPRIELIEGNKSSVMYNDIYLVIDILGGAYGQEARLNLHSFIRSFENDKKLP